MEQLKFTHLHVHTEYSLLDGSSKIKELIAKVKEQGMDSIAITDHGVMFGAIDFHKEATKQGIKPIIGCEVYVAPRTRLDKEPKVDDKNYHLVLLAENQTGYQNLMKLVSKGFIDGFYYRPRIDYDILEEYSEGIIGLSACLGGEVSNKMLNYSYDLAKEAALRYNEILGEGNFFLELQDHGYKEQKLVNQQLIKLSEETNIPLVATNDIHYTYEDDAKAHDILLCIQTNKKVDDEDRMRYKGGQFFCKSPEEMYALFPYAKNALENTYKIAQRCKVDFEFGVTKLPRYDVPEGYDAKSYLRKVCNEGLEERYENITDELRERLDYELSIIEEMGYVDYFLIVWDFIKFARDNDIIVGPGRGSAAGSLVSYTLKITDIDPIRYQLIFERFLNPERVSMPDIDIDFCYERRQEVIDYVVKKYGDDRVVQIITFGTMAARAVIRDVGRALNMPYAAVDKVAKMIPTELGITIEKALKMNKELADVYKADEEVQYLIDMSKRLEGLPRHSSVHAAGVVISEQDTMEYVPLSRSSSDDAITTQFPMTTLEELGLLKMDFLGLRTLTVIQNAVKQIAHSKGIHIDIDHIDEKDEKVYDLIGSGRTEGVFQLESAGMKSFMKELKPRNLEDIIAGISLYRPGPMDFIPKYLKGKNNKESITYSCKELEPILEPTYGCIVYQEQVMQIVRDLAGYTLGRSDLLRRAMSKKKSDVMEEERKNFIYGNEKEGVKGCINNGVNENIANAIYDEMIDFAKYAFNKSHAAAYAIVAYQTAWLKCYYKTEFMAALMTSVMDNSTKVAEYIADCKQLNIELLPPDINDGYGTFSVSNNAIRYGLAAIKNVGRSVINNIVKEREENGYYTSLTNFIERLTNKDLNKRTIESLIKAGAFDSLGANRRQYMVSYKTILDGIVQGRKRTIEGQINLFDLGEDNGLEKVEETLEKCDEYPMDALLSFEKEVLGIYISGHPLGEYETEWKRNISATSIDFMQTEESDTDESKLVDGQKAIIGGIISSKTIKTTRTNQLMAFITVEDLFGSVEVIVFSRDYETYKEWLNEDEKIYVSGRVTVTDETKLICEKIIPFDKVPSTLWLKFKDYDHYMNLKNKVAPLLKDYTGNEWVYIYLEKEKSVKPVGNKLKVAIGHGLILALNELLGKENVKVKRISIDKVVK
ncbi:DNA polymerase III catalytic subunit DnaE type [Natranaerovirga hydrolytica]|uniref:DNA polymerase III subunit alpha n=1 Tax=Natranaerovirga hydrolytica TaxID=680378 RepID=A0A4R1MJR4_9FIRM|nr:DNA polymerase III subunit alpha [Natranaerovirga hydrolytica]TCK90559.1 DNA polymerase III catalytic subunit DnaE type [Natranaerovirga hydrolytica]